MRSFIVFLLTGILSFVAGIFYPWWSLAIVAFVIALIFKQKSIIAFITAFISLFIFWFSYSYFIDLSNDHILAERMSSLFVGTNTPIMMCLFSGIIAGLVAGFSALTGALLRNKRQKKVRSNEHAYNSPAKSL
ncbi:MAG TPA: hypothetical protein VK084_04960 [Chitinophagaceae bacterium]|nr:hypothetical protein [Chitinophagaceae bacterium]